MVELLLVEANLGGLDRGANGPVGVVTHLDIAKEVGEWKVEDTETQVGVVRMPSVIPRVRSWRYRNPLPIDGGGTRKRRRWLSHCLGEVCAISNRLTSAASRKRPRR